MALTSTDLASAAEIKTSPTTAALEEKLELGDLDGLIDIFGPIESGDAEKFASVVSALGVDQMVTGADGADVIVRLHSPGGSFREAIEIARIVDTNKLQTFVERNSECLSACAVIFMAGTYQPGFREQEVRWRKVEWPVKLGFHRPFVREFELDIPQDVLAQVSAEDLEAIFNAEFLAAFDTANELIQEMLRVDPADWRPELLVRMLTATTKNADGQFVYLATVDDALTWGLDIINAVPPASESKKDGFVENFWLCYNAGRAIPAYTGIWPDIPEAEESLDNALQDLDRVLQGGRPGAHWDGKMVEDDELTYYTRVRGWAFGCTIRYERAGGNPEITFNHDDAKVTQTKLLQRYNPSIALNKAVAVKSNGSANGRTVHTDRRKAASGRCYVFRGEERLDDEQCQQSTRTDATVGLVEEYMWPSGGKTVVIRSEDQVTVNGVHSLPDMNGRGEFDFCYRNKETGNTFCFGRQ